MGKGDLPIVLQLYQAEVAVLMSRCSFTVTTHTRMNFTFDCGVFRFFLSTDILKIIEVLITSWEQGQPLDKLVVTTHKSHHHPGVYRNQRSPHKALIRSILAYWNTRNTWNHFHLVHSETVSYSATQSQAKNGRFFHCPALSPLLPKAGAGGMKLGGCCLEGPRIRWWLNYPGVHSEI
uniref:Uncharacterized protein n=1 Tax=Oryza barthii TaxID=65489 RepID=A0A0D3GPC9_9ORYZ